MTEMPCGRSGQCAKPDCCVNDAPRPFGAWEWEDFERYFQQLRDAGYPDLAAACELAVRIAIDREAAAKQTPDVLPDE